MNVKKLKKRSTRNQVPFLNKLQKKLINPLHFKVTSFGFKKYKINHIPPPAIDLDPYFTREIFKSLEYIVCTHF